MAVDRTGAPYIDEITVPTPAPQAAVAAQRTAGRAAPRRRAKKDDPSGDLRDEADDFEDAVRRVWTADYTTI